MSDFFDELNKIFKKDLVPILVKYINDPNNKISEKVTDFINNPRISFNDMIEKFSKNKDNHINELIDKDFEDLTDTNPSFDEYDELLKRLIVIEENMIKIEKILKDKN